MARDSAPGIDQYTVGEHSGRVTGDFRVACIAVLGRGEVSRIPELLGWRGDPVGRSSVILLQLVRVFLPPRLIRDSHTGHFSLVLDCTRRRGYNARSIVPAAVCITAAGSSPGTRERGSPARLHPG